MREIKFKAKDKVTGEWVYFGDLEVENNNLGLICYGDASSPDMDTLCQCVGVCDKNGTEIYENDILSFNKVIGVSKSRGEIRSISQAAVIWYHSGFVLKKISETHLTTLSFEDGEVVGSLLDDKDIINL